MGGNHGWPRTARVGPECDCKWPLKASEQRHKDAGLDGAEL